MHLAAVIAALALVPQPAEVAETGGTCPSNASVAVSRDARLPSEGYRLVVRADSVSIAAADDAGEFYARETMRQLRDEKGAMPCCEIVDSPRYSWRGLMMDDARHFFGKTVVKRCLDLMARHKMNVFHWHLVDDQGWRLELKRHPELVEWGAKRPQSVLYGTKPSWPGGKLVYELDGRQYGPFFYTQEDVREILAYAKDRHIRVVPEIEMPGHVRALLAAHPELSCVGPSLPRVPRVYWSIEDDVLCAGNEDGALLMEDILDEVCELFPDSKVIHIGGDECPKKRWEACAKCQAKMRAKGIKDERGLLAMLTARIVRFLEARGRRAIGWDEILLGDVPKSAIGMSWRTARHGREVMSASEAARRGHDVVCTPNTFCYLDYAQGIDGDPFTYIGGCLPLKRCYWFDPSVGVAEEDRKHILGGQANCWSEYTTTRFDLDWKTWPRACAIAEALWTGPERRDWRDFAERLAVHRRRLVAGGVNAAPFEAEEVPEPEDVPELLTTFGGAPVRDVAAWEGVRRPELLARFLERMYGVRPAAAEKPDVSFSDDEPAVEMMGGKAVRRRVRISYRGPYGTNSFVATAFIPKSSRPVPSFVLICNRSPEKNLDPTRAVKSGFWPAEEIVGRGYAAIAFFNGDVAPETYNPATAFLGGVFPCYERPADRTDQSWGTLSAWAWGASRVMDWIETEPSLDAAHVGVVGHSRGGKTSLLAGATDERFAMTCVNCSGCGGAKLAHVDLPTSEYYAIFLNSRVTYWFCGAFQRYCMNHDRRIEQIDAWRGSWSLVAEPMDFDQHELAALVAPRLLAVASASGDPGAGPVGEFHTVRLASPAWELYGRRGIADAEFPPTGAPICGADVSYHLRDGKHDLTPYDWGVYMDFADAHGWRGE
ncbi:MAG: family 20 glycosylhydrolase [Kiritimatiellae bacterium]|nr:family 20 glycosylhydrolase [Kiritimatiellia bacterium]